MKSICPPSLLTGSHLRTYEKIFQHPASHNLPWRDVLSLFNHLGDVMVEANGHLKVTRNGHALILPTPRTKDVAEVDEIMKLQFFLEHSGAKPAAATVPVARMLLVLDRHVARLFQIENKEAAPAVLRPPAPAEFFRHAHEGRDYLSGKEKPAPGSYFESVALALKEAGQVLILGTGTGTSSEMDQFTGWLKSHHPELAGKISGTLTVDEHHLTEAQLVAKAREFFARPAAARI